MDRLILNLPPELLEAFDQVMAFRDRHGVIRADARETVIQLLKPFLTQSGKLEPSVAKRLGGQPDVGRAQLVKPLLQAVRALVGPLPNLRAWLMAEVSGGFDGLSIAGYRGRSGKKKDAERAIGSPGASMPRQLAQQRDDIAKDRVVEAISWAQHSELGAMAAALLIQELQRAAGATLAMGPGCTVMMAVDTLPKAVQRKVDALAGNEEYRARLAKAVEEITAEFEPETVRTNEQIWTSLPDGIDLEDYFAEREAAQAKAASDQMLAAIDQVLNPQPGQARVPLEIGLAAHTVINAVKKVLSVKEEGEVERRVREATRYMEGRSEAPASDQQHAERLRVMLPTLWQDGGDAPRYAAGLLSANVLGGPNGSSFHFTGDPDTDAVVLGILRRIFGYVQAIGLPPSDVPLEHLPFFGLFASVLAAFNDPVDAGIEAWRRVGACQGSALKLVVINPEVSDLQLAGLEGLNVTRFNEAAKRAGNGGA